MSVKRYSYRKDGNVKLSAHFAVREFRCADGTDTVLIDDELVKQLERIRAHFGKSVKISSAYRTAAHQAKVGKSKNSYHVKGQAADIIITGVSPHRVAQAAEALGIDGVGCYDNRTFTHIDTRPASKRAFWHYNSVGVMKYVATFSECPYTEPSKALQYGDKGAAWIQWHLKKCDAKVSIDGKFGPNTKAALIAFQKAHGLATDGIAGPKTRQALKLEVV
ncbi:MAG: peptidoglycan-binding protein [Clostridia bacterium]|nr:peptidoglycan-binding protein [Clostridia bacterium]